MQRRSLLLLPAALLGGVARGRAAANPYRRLALRDGQGDATSLALLADISSLVVIVMKGHWCGVCLAQVERFAPRRAELRELRASVVGLNADSYRANQEVMRQMALHSPLISDPEHEVIEALGLWLPDAGQPMPAILVFDACGVERLRIVGRSPGDRPEPRVMRMLRELRDVRCDSARA